VDAGPEIPATAIFPALDDLEFEVRVEELSAFVDSMTRKPLTRLPLSCYLESGGHMRLRGKRVGFLIGPGFEDLEFWVPYMRLIEEGATVTTIGDGAGIDYTSKHGCLSATSDVEAARVTADEYNGIVIPGGWCPDKIRRSEEIQRLVRDTYEARKTVAMICHAGLVGISAGIVSGHRATGSEGIKDDLENAGATWVDEAAFVDGPIVWGRVVADIPAFCRELVAKLSA
jgi:protease I